MTAPFVELVAEREGSKLTMRAPADRADEVWHSFKAQLADDYRFTATPVDDLDLRSES